MIGGRGEERTLPLVARYADWWNYNSCPPETYADKLHALKRACERIGRDPATIRLTYSGSISVSSDPRWVQSGIDHRFYRHKYDAARTLTVFSATLRMHIELEDLSERLVDVVEETMHPAHVSLWLAVPERTHTNSSPVAE